MQTKRADTTSMNLYSRKRSKKHVVKPDCPSTLGVSHFAIPWERLRARRRVGRLVRRWDHAGLSARAAIYEAAEIPLDTYLSAALKHVMPGLVADNMRMGVEMITKGSYAVSQATLDTWAAGIGYYVQFCRDNGVDSTYLEGILKYLQQAKDQGHGQDELGAVFECFRKKTGRATTE